jgi:hypothetical protein
MTSSQRSAAILLLAALSLAACKPGDITVSAPSGSTEPTSEATSEPTAEATSEPTADAADAPDVTAGPGATAGTHATPKSTKAKSTTKSPPSGTPAGSGPRIVSFRVAQKPKCEEGTAVFRAKAVPLVIEWKISGADSGALSVDDPTNTPGTYGPVALAGTEEFAFTCKGPVGSTETHTYAIYSVGGGAQKSKSFTVSAKVLDKGVGNG